MSDRLLRVLAPTALLSGTQLVSWLALERSRGEPVAAWSDRDHGLSWACAGSVRTLLAPDLGALAGMCSGFAELTKIVGTHDVSSSRRVPLASVGATFDPRRSGDPWEGWPAAWATIPARLLWTSGQRSGMILHLPGDTARSQQVANEAFDRIATDLAEVPPTPPPFASLPTREPVEQVEAWRARVARALAAIGAGDLQKLVLARAVEHTLAGGAEWDVGATLARLPATDAGAIRFATSPPGARGIVVGATPEVLVRLDGRRVETAALAGTCPRGADQVEDDALAARLLASDKDRREHALVVEAIADALRPLCAQLDLPAAPTLRRLRDVQHLESRFQGTATPGTGVLDLAARLHPTPAVAGAPRDAALAWLRDHEPLARGAYAGAVGHVDPQGGGALAVAIRSALLDGARAWTFAGAGVVAGSDPQAEWDETELKLRTVEGALTARPGGRA